MFTQVVFSHHRLLVFPLPKGRLMFVPPPRVFFLLPFVGLPPGLHEPVVSSGARVPRCPVSRVPGSRSPGLLGWPRVPRSPVSRPQESRSLVCPRSPCPRSCCPRSRSPSLFAPGARARSRPGPVPVCLPPVRSAPSVPSVCCPSVPFIRPSV